MHGATFSIHLVHSKMAWVLNHVPFNLLHATHDLNSENAILKKHLSFLTKDRKNVKPVNNFPFLLYLPFK